MIGVKILVYIVAAYGISNIMVFGDGPFGLLTWIRSLAGRISSSLGDMMSCMMCFPTNLGIVLSLVDLLCFKNLAFTPFWLLFQPAGVWVAVLGVVFDAAFTSGCVWLIHTVQEYFENAAKGE